MKRNKKGFTLAELLIVVAIIAVLVAVSIPVFTAQLEKSRESVDAANLRAAYADLKAQAILDSTGGTKYVQQRQAESGWSNTTISFPNDMPATLTSGANAPQDSSDTKHGWKVDGDGAGAITITYQTNYAGSWDY